MRIMKPRPLRRRPSVSVVIPCYNYGHFLPAAVASALAQDGVDVEVIIVDDASRDGSADVARELAASDARIVAILHESNAGHIKTYNDGLARATGEYVSLLSADDLLCPGALGRAAALFEARPEVGLVYGFPVYFTGTPPETRQRPTSWSTWSGEAWLRILARRGRNPIISPEAVLRRSVLERIGPYAASLPHSADMALWMRAALVSHVGRVNGVDQAFYRVHEANMHATVHAGDLIDLEQRQLAVDSVLPEGALRERAHVSLAREAIKVAVAGRRRGDLTSGDIVSLVSFATAAWPAMRRSTWRRRWELRWLDRELPGQQPVAALRDALWWKYRWRRWRRFGT